MKRIVIGLAAFIGLLMLIFDANTTCPAAAEAVDLCLRVVVPALFPFMVISQILNGLILGKGLPVLRPIGKLCGIPRGSESLLLLGLVGGYPVGAQAITGAYKSGCITKSTRNRLLGFCNNAGPSFIFGLVAAQFQNPVLAWYIWGIHILSALCVGLILPKEEHPACQKIDAKPVDFSKALHGSIMSMAKVCGWVIVFRVMNALLEAHLFFRLPTDIATVLYGLTELTNGCVKLNTISSEGHRFIAAILMLNFGGLCVGMQTVSVCEGNGTGMYFPGKLFQAFIGAVLSLCASSLIFSRQIRMDNFFLCLGALAILFLFLFSTKKWWQFRQKAYIMK